jgi:hypothetical protein
MWNSGPWFLGATSRRIVNAVEQHTIDSRGAGRSLLKPQARGGRMTLVSRFGCQLYVGLSWKSHVPEYECPQLEHTTGVYANPAASRQHPPGFSRTISHPIRSLVPQLLSTFLRLLLLVWGKVVGVSWHKNHTMIATSVRYIPPCAFLWDYGPNSFFNHFQTPLVCVHDLPSRTSVCCFSHCVIPDIS